MSGTALPSPRSAHRWSLSARPVTWLIGLVILVLLGAALAPWSISRSALREEVSAQLRSAVGLYVFPRGSAHVSLLPRPRVRLEDVALVDPNGALVVETPALTGDIRLLPLLAGRLEVTEVALTAPDIAIDIDRAPLTTAGAAARASIAPVGSSAAAKADAARLGIVSIADGTITLRRAGAKIARADHVAARLDWRTVAAPAAATGEFEWLGKRQQFTLWVSQPATLLRGGESPLTFEVRNPETTLTTAGRAAVAARARYEGHVQVSTTSTPDLLASLGLDIARPSVLDTATLDAELVATPSSATLAGLHLSAGGETFEGTLALQAVPDGRPLLTGTLATSSLSLSPYLASWTSLTGPDGRFNAEPFDVAARNGPDIDLRLSAGRVRMDRLRATDAALSVSAKAGRVELSIADASAYGGAVKARATIANGTTAGRSDLQASLLLRDVDWGALDRDLSGQGRLTGTADVTAAVQASGDSVLHMVRSLAGQGKINLASGDLGGLDVPGTLARLDKRPLAAATDLGSGRTRFDRATIPFEIESGVARVAGGEIRAADFVMDIAGTVQIPDGQTAMTAKVRAGDGTADTEKQAGFAFGIAGPWNRPTFQPDVLKLMRRSGAASPLFPTSTAAPAASDPR